MGTRDMPYSDISLSVEICSDPDFLVDGFLIRLAFLFVAGFEAVVWGDHVIFSFFLESRFVDLAGPAFVLAFDFPG